MAILHPHEQLALEQSIVQILKNLMQPNSNRLKAGITILMTSDIENYKMLVSNSVQEELEMLKNLIQNPETQAPLSADSPEGTQVVREHIKEFTLHHLKILDDRLSILPNTYTVTKTIQEGERLKSVIHTSALRNVMTAADFQDKITQKLISEGLSGKTLEDCVKTTSESMLKLHNAVANNDLLTILKELSIKGIDINLPNPDGLSLLQLAAREGHSQIVEVLLKQPGLDVNQVSINGWTALHFAARLGYTDIVKMLLEAKGIDINMANSDGWTALHWASWHGFLPVVNLLLTEKQIEVNQRDSSQGTALHWAARNGQADIIAVLLTVPNIDVNAQDIDRKTPLHYTAAYNHPPATSTLLTSIMLAVNLQDVDGLTPLHWAARNGSLELIGLLMEIPDLRLDLKDNNDMIPADWAKHNQHFELVPLLLPKKMTMSAYCQIYWDKLKKSFSQAWNRG